MMKNIEAMKTIYAANGYIRTTWCCGLSWTEKKLQNHPNAIGFFLETAHLIKF
jgi:threonine synthase